jgi:hypothetical protein
MAIFNDDRRAYLVGAAAALAVTAIARELRTEFHHLGRPLAKAAIKSGLSFIDKAREVMAHMSEVVEDLTIEARYELDAHRTAREEAPPREAAVEENTEKKEVH